ncbi:MAG: pyruvate synthase [Planctomycetes bacterium]|nr:pyruvate synthase [Planctomycetota bacterium]
MKTKREFVHNLKEIPRDELLVPGSPLCAGCGGLLALRLMLKGIDGNVVVVNAAGCMTLLAVYPFTPLRSSWLYTTMGSAAAGAQGVRDALDVLIAKGRIPAAEDLHVVVVAGDGSTLDIGMSSLSGAIHRGLDFYYLCYDNEAYGNTGFQMSSASPFGSRTVTSQPTEHQSAGTLQRKKDLFEIWRAHRPPYIATLSTADPVDLTDKVRRAGQFRGPKLFTAFATCPPGWGYDPSLGHEVAKLALDTGVWPLKEAVQGEERHTYIPDHLQPVEKYLQTQRRFAHLFFPQRNVDALRKIQEDVNAYWDRVEQRESPRGTP